MSEDLQSLLEKINRDGVEKANARAAEIVAAAESKAKSIVANAEEEAAKMRSGAERDAADFAARATESVRQAARDTVLAVEESVSKLLKNLLEKDVDAALADPVTAAALASEAVKGLDSPAEIAAGPKLAAALKAQLASEKNITVVLDETSLSGFSVRIDGGRVEHAFTKDIVAGELARRLRPELAALLK